MNPGAQASAYSRREAAIERWEHVLHLKEHQRLPSTVIAERMGLTVGAVRSVLVRARRWKNG